MESRENQWRSLEVVVYLSTIATFSQSSRTTSVQMCAIGIFSLPGLDFYTSSLEAFLLCNTLTLYLCADSPSRHTITSSRWAY